MNKFTCACAAAALALGFATSAFAQSAPLPGQWPTTYGTAKKLTQTMPAAAWQNLALASLDLRFLIGKPFIAVVNPYDQEIQNIRCDDKWNLIGPDAYADLKAKGAPGSIKARTVAFIPTEGFDRYCTRSLIATTEDGTTHNVHMQYNGNFSQSTYLFFTDVDGR